MNNHILDLFYYVLYDASLFLGAFAILARWGSAHGSVSDQGRFWTGVLATKLMLASFLPMVLSFAGLHQPGVYLALTALLSGAAIYSLRTRLFGGPGSDHLPGGPLLGSRTSVLIFCGTVLAFVPVLLTTILPPSETDSLVNLSKLLEWVQDQKTPYSFANDYVSFAEAAYVPILDLAKQDTLLWLPSFQAVLLFGLAAYQLARLMFSSRALAILMALNGTAIVHLWKHVSGVSTIKNDMVYNAGLLLVVGAALSDSEAGESFLTRLLFVCGFTFAAVKYSGPIFLAGLVGILLVGLRHRWKRHLKPLLIWTAPVLLVTTGHFYIKNLVLHGNPLFPMKLSILGWSLPGTMDFQGTSILANGNRLATWSALLGTLREGFLFPVAFLGLFCFLPIVFAAKRNSEPERRLQLLAAVSVLGWLVFVASQWSAGTSPGSLDYIGPHYSFRYASAADVFTKIVFSACLIRFLPRAFWVVFGVVAGDLLFRLSILYRVPLQVAPPLTMTGWAMALVVLLVVLMLMVRGRTRTALAGIIPLTLIAASPVIGEVNRGRWWNPEFKPVAGTLRRAPGREVVVVDSPALWPLRYPATGQYFQHKVRVQSEKTLLSELANCRNKSDAVALFSMVTIPVDSLSPLTSALSSCGVELVGRSDFSAMYLKEQGNEALPDGPLTASFASKAEMQEIETRRPQPATGLVFAVSDSRAALLTASVGGYRAIRGRASNLLKIGNLGGQSDSGTFSSVELRWTPLGWRFPEEQLEAVVSKYTISSILERGRPSAQWILGGGGPLQIGVSGSPGEQVLRLRAEADMPWLAVLIKGRSPIRDATLTLFGELRCLSKGPCTASVSSNGKFVQMLEVPEQQRWTRFAVYQQFDAQGTEFQFAAGLGSVKSGDLLEVRSLRILRAKLPTGFNGLYERIDRE